MFLTSLIGSERLKTGQMPPHSPIVLAWQDYFDERTPALLAAIPRIAKETMKSAMPPTDQSGFPMWWEALPRDWLSSKRIIDRQAHGPPFDLSDHIIRTVTADVGRRTVHHGADAQVYVDKIKLLLEKVRELKLGVWDVSRSVEALHAAEVDAVAALHRERQKAATVAQRRHEAASGLPEAPVPFLVPVPEYVEADAGSDVEIAEA
ncbi:unnamed protein product [Peniophora sp. CBMAI 1063]|nr:unnamed protein product [Peniophora sp. CBMAI 1063]